MNAEINAGVAHEWHTEDVLVCFTLAVLFDYCKGPGWLIIRN